MREEATRQVEEVFMIEVWEFRGLSNVMDMEN